MVLETTNKMPYLSLLPGRVHVLFLVAIQMQVKANERKAP